MSNCNCDNKGACACAGKNGKANSDQARLTAFRVCEPFCDNGGCRPGTPMRAPIWSFLAGVGNDSLRLAGFELCGDKGVRLIGGTECVPLEGCDPCTSFGPHANAEVRDSDFSPSDAADVVYAFNWEKGLLPVSTITPLPGHPGWYLGRLGSIALSHKFCLKEIAITIEDAAGDRVPVQVTGVRIAGTRIACDPEQRGSYVWVMDRSEGAAPDDIDSTPERCACIGDFCVYTPAKGMELFIFQADINPLDLPSIEVMVEVRRSEWMVVVDKCVGPVGNRLQLADDLAFNPSRRVQPGNVPIMP